MPVESLLRIKNSVEFSMYFRMQEGVQNILFFKPHFALADGTALEVAEVLPFLALVQCQSSRITWKF